MQLRVTTDYAIRALIYLASGNDGANSSEISEAMGIPQTYLINMMQKMRKSGFIRTEAGVGGGYYLLHKPEEITLLDIFASRESTIKINRCLEEGESRCSRHAEQHCPVRCVYARFQACMETYFGSVTIQDLLNMSDTLRLCSGGIESEKTES